MSVIVPESWGELVRGMRDKRGWTQERLAEKAGLSARAISEIETGRSTRPRASTLRLLRKAFDLSPEERQLFRQLSSERGTETKSGTEARAVEKVEVLPEQGTAQVEQSTSSHSKPLPFRRYPRVLRLLFAILALVAALIASVFMLTPSRDLSAVGFGAGKTGGSPATDALPTALADGSIEVVSVREIGALKQPPAVIARYGGASTLIGDQVLWIFKGSSLRITAEDGATLRSSMIARGTRGNILDIVDLIDSNGAPHEFLPFTPEEQEYNAATGRTYYVLSLQPGSIVKATPESALVFYMQVRAPDLKSITREGVGLAHVTLGNMTVQRDPKLLFVAPDPLFHVGAVVEDTGSDTLLYIYECGDDGCRVARAPLAQAGERSEYEAYGHGQWLTNVRDAQPILCCPAGDPFEPDLSVSWNPYLERFLAVYSERVTHRVVIRTALRPEGPWSEASEAFPDTAIRGSGAKEHPELATDGGRKIVLSYSHSLEGMEAELRLVEVTLP
jgi:transcriptional regulator with XRE-family HTH domain